MKRTPEQKERDDARDAAGIADSPERLAMIKNEAIIAEANAYYAAVASRENLERQVATARRLRNLKDYPIPHVFIPEIHDKAAAFLWKEKFEGIKKAMFRFMGKPYKEPDNIYNTEGKFLEEGLLENKKINQHKGEQ